MKISSLEGASRDNSDLRRALSSIQDYLTLLSDAIGIDPNAAQQVRSKKRVPPPPSASLSVTGSNGRFHISINAPDVDGVLIHQVRMSDALPFHDATVVTDLKASPAAELDVFLPNTEMFFAVRSRFQNSAFNSWTFLTGSVSSGLIATASLSNANAARAINGPDPVLVQDGTDAAIIVNETTHTFGGGTVVTYDAGSIKGLMFDLYYVYTIDPTRVGGSVTYYATTDRSEVFANDAAVFIGDIDLRSGGGAVTFPEGFEGGPAIGTVIDMADGTTKLVESLVAGDVLIGLETGQSELVVSTPIPISNVPCFTITVASGKSVTISSDHTLQSGTGQRAAVIDMVPGDTINTKDGQEQITSKTFAGLQTVYNIPLSRNRYHLGGQIWCG